MNTRKGRAKFKDFVILVDSGCSPKILTRRLIAKLNPKQDSVVQWHKQAGTITASIKVKIYFNLTEISATEIMTCNCHVDDSSKGRYYMILGRHILTVTFWH